MLSRQNGKYKSNKNGRKEKSMTQNIFITGGAGFIGSHVAEKMLEEGNEVTVFDNMISGKEDNIKHCLNKEGFHFVQGDILDIEALKQAMPGHSLVWHLGANTDIIKGNNITDFDLKNCTIGTYNVLEAMKQSNVSQIIFASSACVYGDSAPGVAFNESYGPLLPINLYGAGKLACEGLISSYCHLFGISAWIFRFGNVVGDRMGHGVIHDFIRKLNNNPRVLEILGDGKQEKNFFLVEDCIGGMRCAFQNAKSQCDIYTLGSDLSTNVTRIAEIVVEEMGLRDVEFSFTGGSRGWPGDAPVVHFDINKMRQLGWGPNYTSDDAVRIATQRLLQDMNGRS